MIRYAVAFLCVLSAGASPVKQVYRLSSTAAVSWPDSLRLVATPLPSLQGLWLEGSLEGRKVSFWVARARATNVVTAGGAAAEWEKVRQSSHRQASVVSENGCRRIASSKYRCERTLQAPDQPRFLSEALVLNGADDVVIVQARSRDSADDAQAALKLIDVDAGGRK